MSAEILIESHTFGPFVENLKGKDNRVKSIRNNSSELPKGLQQYTIEYESKGHIGKILVGFTPDEVTLPKEESELGEHYAYAVEPFLRIDVELAKKDEKLIDDFVNWWFDIKEDDTWVYITKEISEETKILIFGYADIATAYRIEALEDWVKDIMDNMPQVITKAREIGLLT